MPSGASSIPKTWFMNLPTLNNSTLSLNKHPSFSCNKAPTFHMQFCLEKKLPKIKYIMRVGSGEYGIFVILCGYRYTLILSIGLHSFNYFSRATSLQRGSDFVELSLLLKKRFANTRVPGSNQNSSICRKISEKRGNVPSFTIFQSIPFVICMVSTEIWRGRSDVKYLEPMCKAYSGKTLSSMYSSETYLYLSKNACWTGIQSQNSKIQG